jgi:small subunit ribosomal protein S2e
MAEDAGAAEGPGGPGGPGMAGRGGFGSGPLAVVRAAGLVEARLKTRSGSRSPSLAAWSKT